METMRQFPYDFEAKKEIQFYPSKPSSFEADILEIGPGRGDFIIQLATLYPQKKCVAVELGTPRFKKLSARLEKLKIANTTLIHGDARIVLPEFFKENTFEAIYVLFPDPWPKNKHSFRRLLKVEFITLLSHFLKHGGEFRFGTDVMEYADWVKKNMTQVPSLEPIACTDPLPFPNYEPTFFEKKWRELGKKIYYLRGMKKKCSF